MPKVTQILVKPCSYFSTVSFLFKSSRSVIDDSTGVYHLLVNNNNFILGSRPLRYNSQVRWVLVNIWADSWKCTSKLTTIINQNTLFVVFYIFWSMPWNVTLYFLFIEEYKVLYLWISRTICHLWGVQPLFKKAVEKPLRRRGWGGTQMATQFTNYKLLQHS